MRYLNFSVQASGDGDRKRAYNPRRAAAMTVPWPKWMLPVIGLVMITTFAVVWMI